MEQKVKMLNKSFIILCIIGFLNSLASSCAETLVSKYADFLGGTADQIGLVGSVCSITGLLVLPFAAPLVDAYKKAYIFVASSIILGISFAGFAFSGSVGMLIVFRLLNGVGKGVSAMVCLAMAADVLPPEKMTSGITYFTLAQAISVAIAPQMGLMMLNYLSYFAVFIVTAVIVLIPVLLCAFLKTSNTGTGKVVISLNNMIAKESVMPALLMVCLATAFSTINIFLVVFADTIPVNNIGLFFTVYSLVLLLSRPIVGKLTEKYPIGFVMMPAIGIFAVSMIMISVSKSLPMFLATAVISAFGYGVCQPLVQAMCVTRVGENRRGAGSSTSFIGTNLGYFIGPFVGGRIAGAFGYPIMFQAMVIPLIAAVSIFIFDSKNNGRKEKEQ